MKYLYFKFGRSNNQLKYWLQLNNEKNIFGKPSVVIYFGNLTSEKYKSLFKIENKEEYKAEREKDENIPSFQDLHYQIKPFFNAGEKKDAKFISIHKNKVYILEPESEVFDMPKQYYKKFIEDLNKYKIDTISFEKDILKIIHIKIIKILEKDVPYILRTLNINQYFNRGTCREIKEKDYWEIIQAMTIVLNEKRNMPKKLKTHQFFRLLSPHQFETLIFLILTNAGLYSPAWRAGSFPDIDIIGINYSNHEVKIGANPLIEFKKNKEITFQIKRKMIKKEQNTDYTIALSSPTEYKNNNKILTSEWLLNIIKDQSKTMEWLENSLKWYIKDTRLKSIFDLVF